MHFVLSDFEHEVPVEYTGVLPDLFREGQGIVAEGVLDGPDSLRADAVLAKHDERYMPRDVADKLKKQGRWQGQQAQAQAPAPGNASAAADTPPLK